MALLLREMKGVNFSCVSPSSTAIYTSKDRRPTIRATGGRALDRHTPHLRDYRRGKVPNPLPQYPSKPKSHHQKSKKRPEKPTDQTSPPGSSRHLLNDTDFFDVFPDFEPLPSLLPLEPSRFQPLKEEDESAALRPSSSTRQEDQVVVLKVSLHCKGCVGKVRKHISKMEGVTSFNIDMATKKVTVVGDVTPLGVLTSVSKVKNAQFWS